MTITTTQKIIKIGTSKGVTLPAKELRQIGVDTGDEVELVVRKRTTSAADGDVQQVANAILKRYDRDFRHLSGR